MYNMGSWKSGISSIFTKALHKSQLKRRHSSLKIWKFEGLQKLNFDKLKNKYFFQPLSSLLLHKPKCCHICYLYFHLQFCGSLEIIVFVISCAPLTKPLSGGIYFVVYHSWKILEVASMTSIKIALCLYKYI